MGGEKGQQAQGDLRCSTSSARTQDDPSYSLMSFLTQYDGVKDEILSLGQVFFFFILEGTHFQTLAALKSKVLKEQMPQNWVRFENFSP